MSDRKRYKTYLEPGSLDPVPSSSFFRYKKLRAEKDKTNTQENILSSNDTEEIAFLCCENVSEEISDKSIPECVPESSHENIFETTENSITENYNPIESDILDKCTVYNVMESLAEDIEAIENEVEEHVEEESDQFGDFFEDAIDNDENLFADEKDEDQLSFGRYTSLYDAINNDLFKKPVTVVANKTVGEVILMVLKFILVHALSLTEMTDLFVMINCIFVESFLPSTRYLIDKLFYPKNSITLHAICSKCGAGIGKFDQKSRFLKCKFCKSVINVKDKSYKDFFVMMDVESPISMLIESNSEYYDYVVNKRVFESGRIHDIYDGKKYREFLSHLSDADKDKYATVIFNTDGAPLFKSSSYSIWPIFLMVNEVPLNIRTKELILAGLWFGKEKPNMNVFLEPYVDHMNKLSTNGVECNINGEKRNIKIFNLICCVDSVARAPVQGFTQFNGRYGCSQCLHPGEWVRNNPSTKFGNIKYPLMNKAPKQRNVQDTINHMKKSATSKDPIFGIKNPSQLMNLMYYDIIYGCIVEPMHCLSGVAKQFATMWFGNKRKTGLLSKTIIPEIDAALINIKVPHQIVRLTRALSEKAFWKAREWENWTLFYSMIVLKNVLPEPFLEHWALFVEAIYILTKEEILASEVDFADKLLHEFVARTEILYSKVSMTFNVHLLLHLARSVLDWGPLWCHNTYAFESGNGDLLKVIHAAKGVHHQICRRISLKYSFALLKDHVIPFSSYTTKNYCNSIGTTVAKKTFQSKTVRYFGSTSQVNLQLLKKLNCSNHTVAYQKIVKNGCLYTSSSKNKERSDNSFAQLKDGMYVKLVSFIIDTVDGTECTTVHKIITTDTYQNVCGMLRKIVQVINEKLTVLTSDIDKVCVHLTMGDDEYLCTVPNLWYY